MKSTTLMIAISTLMVPGLTLTGCASQPITGDSNAPEKVMQVSQNEAKQPEPIIEPNPGNNSVSTIDSQPMEKELDQHTLSEENRVIAEIQSESLGNAGPEINEQAPVMVEIQQAIAAIPSANDEALNEYLPDADHSELNDRPARITFKFGFDKSELPAVDKDIIIQHGRFLSQHPEKRIQIHGHADAQGEPAYNQYLATKRANHVAELLKAEGVKPEQIEIISWGSDKPLQNATAWRDHRRVEILYDESYMVQAPVGEDN